MRITGVHTAVVEPNYDWTFVRIDAGDEGPTGWDGRIIDRGRIEVPDSTGLGAALKLDVARRYARPGEPFFDE